MLPPSRAEFSLKRLSYFPEPALSSTRMALRRDLRVSVISSSRAGRVARE
jgi:hypothetical protein